MSHTIRLTVGDSGRLTADINHRAAWDAGTRRAKRQGRERWNAGDWDEAARVFDELEQVRLAAAGGRVAGAGPGSGDAEAEFPLPRAKKD